LVPSNTSNGFHRFESDVWLLDSRVLTPDLAIITASMSAINIGPIAPHIYITTVVQNNGPVDSGAPTYLQVYERVAPSPPPTGPADLDGGWCTFDITPQCPSIGFYRNPIGILPSNTTLTLTSIFTPLRGGLLDIYVQLDSLGGPIGLTAESDENNNLAYVGSVRLNRIWLPLIRK
jgi:hypothetical protein